MLPLLVFLGFQFNWILYSLPVSPTEIYVPALQPALGLEIPQNQETHESR